jgi:hypothetical protein
MVASTVQPGVLSGTPIVARNPPPEGQMAVQLPVTLTPSIFATNGLQQLSSGQVGGMSQIVTLIIDNTPNNVPITVVHGALNETLQVAANTQATVPTFSGQGYWPWQVFTPTPPAANVNVGMILLNYERSSGIYRQTSNTIQNTGENSGVLVADTLGVAANSANLIIPAGPAGSIWVLDSLDVSIETVQSTAAGSCFGTMAFSSGTGGTELDIEVMDFTFTATAAHQYQPNPTPGAYRTWSQGLLINTNQAFYINASGFNNVSDAIIRYNVSGYNVAMPA